MGFRGTEIPQYIKAGSPEGLRQLMFRNNAKLGGFVNYFDITFVQEPGKKPYWIAWFFLDVENNDPMFKEKAGE